ncbi:MAG: FAD-dependent oxidoreductase [Pirellulaceae bacterium]
MTHKRTVTRKFSWGLVVVAWGSLVGAGWTADQVLVEAESFADQGGWVLDTQFIATMGSPYLLAHGLGRPVPDAVTQVTFPSAGTYRVFVRTKDWVAPWKADGQPGRFQVLVHGSPLAETFGTTGAEWFWQPGGTVEIQNTDVSVALHDLTGFEGRCDAILFTKDLALAPPNDGAKLTAWRREVRGLPTAPTEKDGYDLVVVGGGYAGMGSAIAAARLGCRVALLQDRPVLGGNGSSEVRVWANGLIRRGEFPRVGEIVEEFADSATKSPGRAEEFGDDVKEKVVRAEPNIDLFLNCHAYQVEMAGTRIGAVRAMDTRHGELFRFAGKLFADCTGHGALGFLAGADAEMTPKQRMGMSNMWVWEELDHDVDFPATPWALDLEMDDFPYPRDFHAEWFWESGFDKDPIREAETIRDWNLRAVYGAFQAMKNRGGRDQHRRAQMSWVAFVGGPRESRRLIGDIVLSQEDVVGKVQFPDGIVPTTWSIDLHFAKPEYAKKYPDNPFISIAEFDHRVDRTRGYPVPYRCFYSRNIDNLFMAGRCISVTHEALGTVRVMKTCGMMGEVVGKAASLCTQFDCTPREIYTQHLDALKQFCQLPGKARRATLTSPLEIPTDVPVARPEGPPTGLDPGRLPGIVMDDVDAVKTGAWSSSDGLQGYVGSGYLYAAENSGAAIEFRCTASQSGRYEVRLAYRPHENRGARVPVRLQTAAGEETLRLDLRKEPPLSDGFLSLGIVTLEQGGVCRVTMSTEDAHGLATADAVQLLPLD